MCAKKECKTTDSARFSGVANLFGQAGLACLARAHVCVIGLGGVGSWVAEGLARSGVGQLTLIDQDEVCPSNVNRQVQAQTETFGRDKAEVMRERIQSIAPSCCCRGWKIRVDADTIDDVLADDYDWVVDALDDIKAKCLLIDACRRQHRHILTAGGAGGRVDPSLITVADLSRSRDDPLLARVRKRLRQKYDFPRNSRERFRVPCVFSPEPIRYLREDGTLSLNMPRGERATAREYGTLVAVTAAFGFAATAWIIRRLAVPE